MRPQITVADDLSGLKPLITERHPEGHCTAAAEPHHTEFLRIYFGQCADKIDSRLAVCYIY